MSGLPLEQPPEDENVNLTEWLARMMILISAEFERGLQLEPFVELPDKVQEGMVRFFDIAIDPEIPEPGPYIYMDGEWVSLTSPAQVILYQITEQEIEDGYEFEAGGIYWLPEIDGVVTISGPYFYNGADFWPMFETSGMAIEGVSPPARNAVGEMRFFPNGTGGNPPGPYCWNSAVWVPMFYNDSFLPTDRCPTP